MRFFIESVSGKKGYKSFKDLNEYINFMTEKGHLIKTLKEADLPYSDKPVKLPSVSKSKGWSEVTDFGDIDREAEKAKSVLASTSDSIMKDEASMEVSPSKEAKDKPEMGLAKEKGDGEMANFKEFKYEEPEMKSSETKSEPKKEEAPKADSEPKEEKKEESKSEEKDDDKKEKKEKVDESFKDYIPRAGFIRNNDEDKSSKKMGIWGGQGSDEQLRKAKIIAKVKFANGDRFGRVTKADLDNFSEYKRQYDEIYGSGYDSEIEESLKSAGVKLNEDRFQEIMARMNQGRITTVKELMNKLSQCDPNALVIVSEKPGRGANQCYVYQGFTDEEGYELADEQDEQYNIPAIEITCNM